MSQDSSKIYLKNQLPDFIVEEIERITKSICEIIYKENGAIVLDALNNICVLLILGFPKEKRERIMKDFIKVIELNVEPYKDK